MHVQEYRDDKDRPWIKVVYRDNGLGITEENLEKVFEEGFRSVPKDRKVGGHGKGLAYVRQVLHRLHGRIHAEVEKADEVDEAPRGAKFVLFLPLAVADD